MKKSALKITLSAVLFKKQFYLTLSFSFSDLHLDIYCMYFFCVYKVWYLRKIFEFHVNLS